MTNRTKRGQSESEENKGEENKGEENKSEENKSEAWNSEDKNEEKNNKEENNKEEKDGRKKKARVGLLEKKEVDALVLYDPEFSQMPSNRFAEFLEVTLIYSIDRIQLLN